MRHWPISHLTMSRMCPPCMQSSLQGLFRAARSREGEAGQVCVEPHPIVEWMTMVFFFGHEYFKIQPVLQLPSLPPCQLTLFRSLKPDIFPLLSNVENTHSSKHIIFMKKVLLWHISTRISLNLLCYLTGWIFLVQWTTGLLLQTRVQQPQPQWAGMLLMSNNAKKHGPATENNKSSLKNKSTGCK